MSATIRREQGASRQPSRFSRWLEGEVRIGISDKRQETSDKGQETRDKGQETRDKGHATTTPSPSAAPTQVRAPRPAPLKPLLGHREAFAINFIRRDTVPLVIRRILVYVAFGYLVVNVVVLLCLLACAQHDRAQWAALRSSLEGPGASSGSVKALQQETSALRERASADLGQLTAMAALDQQRLPVAGKLAALTRTLPARTWITGLSGRRDGRAMTIRAAYLINPENPYEMPTKAWIDALRADPAFRAGLTRLELGSSARKMQASAELVTFELTAEWTP